MKRSDHKVAWSAVLGFLGRRADYITRLLRRADAQVRVQNAPLRVGNAPWRVGQCHFALDFGEGDVLQYRCLWETPCHNVHVGRDSREA